MGTNQIDDLQEPHNDFTRSPSFQDFQDCKHSVRRDQLTLHLGSLGYDAQLFFPGYHQHRGKRGCTSEILNLRVDHRHL
jgi:hypothetical protein